MRDGRSRQPAVASTLLRGPLLGAPLDADVLGVVGRTCYLAVGPDTVVALEGRGGPGLPIACVLPAPGLEAVLDRARGGARPRIGGGGLALGDVDVVAARWSDPRPRLVIPPRPALGASTAALHAALADRPVPDDPAAGELAAAAGALRVAVTGGDAGHARAAASGLVGLGGGLTPAGDDLLAGVLATLRLLAPGAAHPEPLAALGDALATTVVAAAAERTTALSAALLRASNAGAVPRGVAVLLRALTGRGDVAAATRDLLTLGHSSGRWLAEGVALGAAAASGLPAQRDALAGKER